DVAPLLLPRRDVGRSCTPARLLAPESLMSWSVRIATSVVVIGSVLAGTMHADQRLLASLALDLWDLPANHWQLECQRHRREDLTKQIEATGQRLARKDRIAHEVVVGQLDLRKAAGRYLEASQDCPYHWDYLVENHADWPLEKRC